MRTHTAQSRASAQVCVVVEYFSKSFKMPKTLCEYNVSPWSEGLNITDTNQIHNLMSCSDLVFYLFYVCMCFRVARRVVVCFINY